MVNRGIEEIGENMDAGAEIFSAFTLASKGLLSQRIKHDILYNSQQAKQ